MYKIIFDEAEKKNEIRPMKSRLLKDGDGDLNFREREHLQEWIAKEPSVLGEQLLIIQKEYAGFQNTRDRLDLLALDTSGNLVVIELKRDDTGRSVTWQAMRYAGYCSRMNSKKIKAIYQQYLAQENLGQSIPEDLAEKKLEEFFGEEYEEDMLNKNRKALRIMLVATSFRREVTSTVLWLRSFDIEIQCFRANLFVGDEPNELYLSMDLLIPTKDSEGYMIGIDDEEQDGSSSQKELKDRHVMRINFWEKLLGRLNQTKCTLFQNISPGKANCLWASAGVNGATLGFCVTDSYAHVRLYIYRSDEKLVQFIFGELENQKEHIEKNFYGTSPHPDQGEDGELIWENQDNTRYCRIKSEMRANISNREQWDEIMGFLVDNVLRLEKALKSPLDDIKKRMKDGANSDPDDQDAP